MQEADLSRQEFFDKMMDSSFLPSLKGKKRIEVACMGLAQYHHNKTSFEPPKSPEFPALQTISVGKSHFISKLLEGAGSEFSYFLQFSLWKAEFIELIERYSSNGIYGGSKKNEFMMAIYEMFTTSPYFNVSRPEDRELFLKIYKEATKIVAKIEEESLVQILYGLFTKKEQVDPMFFKEMFVHYLENIKTDAKYQLRINKIKEWAKTEDFSSFYDRYKNIKKLFVDDGEDKPYIAQVRKYNFKDMAKAKKLKASSVEHLFKHATSFIQEKLKTDLNIENILLLDEVMHYKLLIVYYQENSNVWSLLDFYDMVENKKDTTESDEDFLNRIWAAISFKNKLDDSLQVHEAKPKARKI